jgi:hypothetical protein
VKPHNETSPPHPGSYFAEFIIGRCYAPTRWLNLSRPPPPGRARSCARFRFQRATNALPRSRGAMRPSCAKSCPSKNRGRRESRVPVAPAAACAVVESTRVSHHRSTGTPGLPCAMVLTAYSALSPVTGLVCHRRQRDAKHHRQLDTSVGVSGPHDFAVRISVVRPRKMFALRRCRVHRIPRPTSVTIAKRPSVLGWDGDGCRSDLGQK